MIDERRMLERAAGLVEPPERVMDGLYRRRARRQRNRRAGAFAVGLAVVIIAALVAYRLAQPPGAVPANPPSITSVSVRDLGLIWTGAKGEPMNAPTIAGPSIFVASSNPGASAGTLYAFPTDCQTTSSECAPTWRGDVGPWMTQPIVGDGLVFTVDVANAASTDTLYAFDVGCGSDGQTCSPTWTARSRVGYPVTRPIVTDGSVYVGRPSGVEVFSTTCGSSGDLCQRSWFAPTKGFVVAMAVSDDTLFVGTRKAADRVYAFPLRCAGRCEPSWIMQMDAGAYGLSVSGDHLYVGTNAGFLGTGPGLEVFSLSDCETTSGDCAPRWTAARAGDVVRAVEHGGQVFVQDFNAISVYPVDCRSDGEACDPVWEHVAGADAPFVQGIVPTISDDVVFTGRQDGDALAFSTTCADPCEPIWTAEAGFGTVGGVEVSGSNAFAASDAGVVAFGLHGKEDR